MQKNAILTRKKIFAPPLAVWVCASLLIAVGVALKTVSLTIPLGGIIISRVGFQLVPTYLSAILFGPFIGGLVGFFTDFLSMLIAPVGGGYNPLFGITYIVAAVLAWAIFNLLRLGRLGKLDIMLIVRIIVTVVAVQCAVLFLNTLWNAICYGTNDESFILFLLGRSTSLIFYIPVFSAVLCILLPVLSRQSQKLYKK